MATRTDKGSAAGVDYQLVIYDELPPAAVSGGAARSVLGKQLEVIRRSEEAWGRPVRIALYSNGGTASSAKQSLERRFRGDPEWSFYTRPVPVDTSSGAATHKGLFAMFRPGGVAGP